MEKSNTLYVSIGERLYMALIDILVRVNNHTLHKDLVHHDCKRSRITCDMLERESGAPWSLLIPERRHRKNSGD